MTFDHSEQDPVVKSGVLMNSHVSKAHHPLHSITQGRIDDAGTMKQLKCLACIVGSA